MVVASAERQVRIEVAYGLEGVLPDGLALRGMELGMLALGVLRGRPLPLN